MSGSGTQAGPYGYVDKGSYFTDERVSEFPEKIEIIYQVNISSVLRFIYFLNYNIYDRALSGPWMLGIQQRVTLCMEVFTMYLRTKSKETLSF